MNEALDRGTFWATTGWAHSPRFCDQHADACQGGRQESVIVRLCVLASILQSIRCAYVIKARLRATTTRRALAAHFLSSNLYNQSATPAKSFRIAERHSNGSSGLKLENCFQCAGISGASCLTFGSVTLAVSGSSFILVLS